MRQRRQATRKKGKRRRRMARQVQQQLLIPRRRRRRRLQLASAFDLDVHRSSVEFLSRPEPTRGPECSEREARPSPGGAKCEISPSAEKEDYARHNAEHKRASSVGKAQGGLSTLVVMCGARARKKADPVSHPLVPSPAHSLAAVKQCRRRRRRSMHGL